MSQLEERCVECGTEVATISATPLCSKDCQKQYATRMIRNMSDDGAWCPTCNKEFDSVKRVCYHHNKKHSFEVYRTEVCDECEKVFRPSSTENENKYCSEECFSDSQHKGFVEVVCSGDFCDDTFKVRSSEMEVSERKYCSQSCANAGSQHPMWVDEKTSEDIRNTPEYTQWKKNIHKSSDVCESCGTEENLQAHHKIPVAENKSLATNVENGILLCGDCHHKNHPNMPEELFKL